MNDSQMNANGPSRRQFCRTVTAAAFATTLGTHAFADEGKVGPGAEESEPIDPSEAVRRLTEGNRRFVDGKSRHPHETRDWRLALEGGQHPFAAVLGCADSRAVPELLFDQGFGDLFVVRVAGNIVDVDVTASLEYAVDHLSTKLVVVLGHTNCGAVTATLDHLADSASEPEEIVSLLYRIEPAVAGIPEEMPRRERIALGVRKNVEFAVTRLRQVPDMMRNIKRKQVRVLGAVYDMHTGKVAWLDS